jgi:hypothetical protein
MYEEDPVDSTHCSTCGADVVGGCPGFYSCMETLAANIGLYKRNDVERLYELLIGAFLAEDIRDQNAPYNYLCIDD